MSEKDQPAHMWRCWLEKYGTLGALKEYYPETYANDPTIRTLAVQMESAELMINQIMTKRAEEADPDYEYD